MSDLERKLSEVERDTDLMKELKLSNQQVILKQHTVSCLLHTYFLHSLKRKNWSYLIWRKGSLSRRVN